MAATATGGHIPQQEFAELLKLLCREQAGMESEKFQPRQPHDLAVVLQGLFNDWEKTTMPMTTAVWTPMCGIIPRTPRPRPW